MWFLVLCLALSLGGTGAVPAIQSRIVAGWECKPHSQPWQAALYHYSTFQCGGVLVHPQWVLTAAHCISDHYQLWLGRHDLFEDEDTAQFVLVSKSFPHPEFNMSLLKNHTHLPDKDYSIEPEKFSFPDILQCVDLKILSNDECDEAHTQKVTESMLCAGPLEGGQDTCVGDSGGPLTCDGVLQGIISWGYIPCGSPNKPSVFVRVLSYMKWIKDTIADNS
uniref:Kallikrein 1 n=1 Tax=Aotus nancymaae TaxID=37293 RepID=A0A2K5DBV7_AOTNA